MKVISIGIDDSVLDKNSKSAKRLIEYGELVKLYCVIVPSKKDREVILSSRVKVVGIGGCCKAIKLFKIFRKLNSIVRQENIDVITTQDPHEIAFVSWLVARKNKIGLNVQLHGDFFSSDFWRNQSRLNKYRYYLAKFVLKKADSIRVVSGRVKKSLVAKLDIRDEKIITVPIYSDHEIREQKVVRDSRGAFTYLWIGRFVVEKNLEMLVRAFKKVVEEKPDSFLRLVGGGGTKEQVKKIASSLGLLEKIEFKDWVDSVDQEYQKADAYVLSSDNEGWGMVVVEAMRNSLPVIMTNVGCAGELVKNNINGIVVPVGDKSKLTEGMLKMQDKDARRMYVSNIRKNLEDLPSKKETLKLYLESWKKALR